jgi:hypothetical protein
MPRSRLTWIIVAAVVALVVVAGVDVLRSSGGKPTASARATTTHTRAGREVVSSSELRYLRVVRLLPGRVTTDPDFRPVHGSVSATFTVPDGWYGYQGPYGLVIRKGFNAEAGTVASGGISVARTFMPFASAARGLEDASEIRVDDVSPVRIGGHSGRKYVLEVHRWVSVPGIDAFQPGEASMILLRLGPFETLAIRPTFDNDQVRPEIEAIVMSFRFEWQGARA